ncbi:MAG: type III-A CRISPR-associated RAMP protein Csm3 [Nitrososphaerota archaeon]
MSKSLRLLGLVNIDFKMRVIDGLLIKSGKAKEMIGGVDIQTVSVDYPYELGDRSIVINVPYVPGSSLKGRARSLLEVALGLPLKTTDRKIYLHMRVVADKIEESDPFCPVDNVFGSSSISPDKLVNNSWWLDCWAPTRALFSDLKPSIDYVKKLAQEKGHLGLTFSDFVEEKWENRIDRVTSAADPRNALRVKPGVEFEGRINFLVFDRDICPNEECVKKSDEKTQKSIREMGSPALYYLYNLFKSLALVEETYLGSSGTRGYGRVKFENIKINIKEVGSLNVKAQREYKTLSEVLEKFNELKGAFGFQC